MGLKEMREALMEAVLEEMKSLERTIPSFGLTSLDMPGGFGHVLTNGMYILTYNVLEGVWVLIEEYREKSRGDDPGKLWWDEYGTFKRVD